MIKVTKLQNGLLFDLTELLTAGVSQPYYIFSPISFKNIGRVEVFSDRVQFVSFEMKDYNFSFNGAAYPKLKVNGVESESNIELFNTFISLL